MNSSFAIREASRDDIPAMTKLLETLFSLEKDFKIDQAKQARGLQLLLEDRRKACALLAVDGEGAVRGMATIQLVASSAEGAFSGWIEDVVVEESFRRRGVAKALLEALTAWGESKGATRFQLLADKGNKPALEFYKKLGWSTGSMICLKKS